MGGETRIHSCHRFLVVDDLILKRLSAQQEKLGQLKSCGRGDRNDLELYRPLSASQGVILRAPRP